MKDELLVIMELVGESEHMVCPREFGRTFYSFSSPKVCLGLGSSQFQRHTSMCSLSCDLETKGHS